jgi:type I restriction enzyme S subunit
MVNGNLPDGWEWTTVGECSTVITGKTPSKKDDSNYGNFMPFVKPPELLNSSIYSAEDNISEKGTKDARVLPINSVLVSCIGNLGKTGINRVPVAFNQQINAVLFPENIIPEFGFYYFQSSEFKQQLEDISSATTVAIVNKSKFESLSFPLAPLPEQERIVAKIEELFTQLEAGTNALERVRAGLRRYKASVLKAACDGKLVESGRSENGDLPDGWQWKSASEFCIAVESGSTPKADFMTSGKGEVPFLKVYNLKFDGTLDFTIKPTFISVETQTTKLKRSRVYPGDVLTNIVGPPLGKVSIVPDTYPEWNINQAIVLFRTDKTVDNKYLSIVLQSPDFMKRIIATSKATAGQFNVSLTTCRTIPMPIAPLEEQRRIVAEVERRLSVAREVESAVEGALVRAGRLRQAVLKSAFEGKLA